MCSGACAVRLAGNMRARDRYRPALYVRTYPDRGQRTSAWGLTDALVVLCHRSGCFDRSVCGYLARTVAKAASSADRR
jgi:hypothetical protein